MVAVCLPSKFLHYASHNVSTVLLCFIVVMSNYYNLSLRSLSWSCKSGLGLIVTSLVKGGHAEKCGHGNE